MATTEEFKVLYETNLKPKLVQFEKQRKHIARNIKFATIGIIISIIILFVIFNQLEVDINWFFSLSGFIVLGGLLYYLILVSPYEANFKKEVVSRIVTFVDNNLVYYPNRMITRTEFQDSLLEKYWWHPVERWTGGDYVEGKLGFTAMKFSEVHAEYKEIEEDNVNKITLFKGLFFIFDFNKDFEGFTVVLPENEDFRKSQRRPKLKFKNNRLTLTWNSGTWRTGYGELVKLEDPEFEKEFAVYSDNQITARYVLSTSLIRRLLKFRHLLKKPIYLSFVNGTLYMGIPIYKNLFEPTVFKTLLDFKFIYEFFEYMQLGKDIVTDLNLNTRIWSKQPVINDFQEADIPEKTENSSILTDDSLTQLVSQNHFQ